MLKVTAIANQKGGVGKTSTCVNLCAGLGLMGKHVLLIDMDPQSNSTSGIGVERHNLDASVYDMLVDEVDFQKCVMETQWKGVSILPSYY
jgi:chromosome partitioning protein